MPQAHTWRVASARTASPLTRIVRLALDGDRFTYRAGQSVRLGLHGQPLRKYYSIASAPEESRQTGQLEFLVKVDAEGHAGAHLPRLARGTLVDVEGPYGDFVFPDAAAERRFLFIAGGTGIAPLRAMLRHALAAKRRGRFAVVYSARSTDEFAYVAELRQLARAGAITLALTATRGAHVRWRGGRGRVDRATLAPLVSEAPTLCFLCGPADFTASVRPLLEQLGIEPDRIRTGES